MAEKKLLYTYVDVTDDTPVHKLGVLDQLRLLLRHISYDAASELGADDTATKEYLTLRANLLDLIDKSLRPIRVGKKRSVVIQVSSKFKPVLKEVLSSKNLTDFYTIKVSYPKVDYDIALDVLVYLEVKET